MVLWINQQRESIINVLLLKLSYSFDFSLCLMKEQLNRKMSKIYHFNDNNKNKIYSHLISINVTETLS